MCPKGTNKDDRFTYELVTSFFLFFRHSKMLPAKEDFERNFEGAVIRFFSSLIRRVRYNDVRRQLNRPPTSMDRQITPYFQQIVLYMRHMSPSR